MNQKVSFNEVDSVLCPVIEGLYTKLKSSYLTWTFSPHNHEELLVIVIFIQMSDLNMTHFCN